ncbi:MAG: transcriptional regulator, LuxR family [Mycobacterium sp.]|nr:transcriptional regulator, LuxR family [Mycobacterium sp.]
MRREADMGPELGAIASSSAPLPERARELVLTLRHVLPFDGAWLAVPDGRSGTYTSLANVDLDDGTVSYLTGPEVARDIDLTGANRPRPPLSPSDLPYPAETLPTWAECLLPAGFREALAGALFARDGRHVGFFALLSGDDQPLSPTVRRRLARVTPLLGDGIDPMRSLLTAARLVQGASAGVVLRSDGSSEELPGLPGHALLAPDSALLGPARAALEARHVYTSFLWPLGGHHAPGGHVRVTALGRCEDMPPPITGTVLLSPPGNLHGLTPRELEVLGLVTEGFSNAEIARALVVSPRTVAAHLEHILAKLSARTRTLAGVRAERDGLFVPWLPAGSPDAR